MKSLVKLKAEPGIWMQDCPMPDYAPNEVLIKIINTAICGTDIHIYKWDEWAKATIPVPMIIGHEFYGEIVALGDQVQGLKLGQKVSGEGHITCGLCRNCRTSKRHFCAYTQGIGVNRTGCFAEYLALPSDNVVALPDDINANQGAVLDPLGNAAHCALAFDIAGEDVLITGAGPIGIMACALAKHLGARQVVITDVNAYRLDLALKMGATHTINVKQQSLADLRQALSLTEGFTVGLEMSGTPAGLNDMVNHLSAGANIALLGILPEETLVDWQQIIFKGLTLKGIYGREMFRTWYKMIAMLQSGLNINPVITHHFNIEDYQQAFELMASGQSGKVILNWV